MKGTTSRAQLFSTLALSISMIAMPFAAFASTVVTKPMLAADKGTCSTMTATNVTPYIYNGELNSFDVTVSNPKAVALGGTVGSQTFGFQVVNRMVTAAGTKIHVDLSSMKVGQGLPVQVTFMSTEGQQICLSIVSDTILGSGTSYEPIPQETPTHVTPKPYSQSSYAPKTPSVPSTPKAPTNTGTKPSTTTTKPSASSSGNLDTKKNASSSAFAASPSILGALSSVSQACSNGHAARLWVVLLVLYALFVLALLLQKPDVFGPRTNEWSSGLILVLFLALLGFWYMAAACRAGPWVPAVATLIACAGLIVLSRWTEDA